MHQLNNYKMVDAISDDGCPVCILLKKNEFDLLCDWVGISGGKSNNPEKRTSLSVADRFCNYHFWELKKMCTDCGNAQISLRIIDKIVSIIQDEKKVDGLSVTRCHLCDDLKRQEAVYIKEITSLLTYQDNRNKYAAGQGLCLFHLIQVMNIVEEHGLTSFLLKTTEEQFERIKQNELGLLSKMHPPLKWQQTKDEKKSCFRAIEKLVGRRGAQYR